MATASRVALGTAQFGLDYGVSNRTGQVALREARDILTIARDAGMDTIDTALDYGDSESRLGELGVAGWRVVSKLPAIPDDCGDVRGWVTAGVVGSLERLRIPKLQAILLHRPMQLLGERGTELYCAMRELCERHLCNAIGVSIYDPEELELLLPRFPMDVVQAPFNILDRRLATSGWLNRLQDEGVEVHTRSAFLQGLLLMRGDERPARFERWRPLWQAWDGWLEQHRLSALDACLQFVLSQSAIQRVVVGVQSAAQLGEIIVSASVRSPAPPEFFDSEDQDLINPARWNIR